MTSLWCAACVAVGLAAAGCGGSPTAPTSLAAPTDPVASVVTEPFPAPVSQTLTGTWFLGDRRFMTLTQDGASVTGMPSPFTFVAGNGVTVAESGTISGAIDGERVTLVLTDRITVNGSAPRLNCSAGHTFTGTLAGNTLSGVMTTNTPLACGSGVAVPDIPLPTPNGPTTYTRQ